MLSSILAGLAGNVVVGWIRRRLLEVAGLVGAILPFILAMPPEQQAIIIAVLTGQGGALSIAAVVGFGVYVFGQWRSWRATVNPHVVTSEKTKIDVPVLTEAEARALTGYTGPIERR